MDSLTQYVMILFSDSFISSVVLGALDALDVFAMLEPTDPLDKMFLLIF